MTLPPPPQIEELKSVFLFGSHARGDADKASDVDICLFADVASFPALLDLKSVCAGHYRVPQESITVYTVATVQEMARVGSLFLWHLRLEGKLHFDTDGFGARILSQLESFEDYDDQLRIFGDLHADIREFHDRGELLTELDLHVLYTIARDVCVLLTYWSGTPAFGRESAYVATKVIFPDLPLDSLKFAELSSWHLKYTRDKFAEMTLPTPTICSAFINQVGALLAYARRIVS